MSTQLLITIGAKVDCVFTGVHNVRNPATENASQEPESTGGTNSASPNFMSNSWIACIIAPRTSHVNAVIRKMGFFRDSMVGMHLVLMVLNHIHSRLVLHICLWRRRRRGCSTRISSRRYSLIRNPDRYISLVILLRIGRLRLNWQSSRMGQLCRWRCYLRFLWLFCLLLSNQFMVALVFHYIILNLILLRDISLIPLPQLTISNLPFLLLILLILSPLLFLHPALL